MNALNFKTTGFVHLVILFCIVILLSACGSDKPTHQEEVSLPPAVNGDTTDQGSDPSIWPKNSKLSKFVYDDQYLHTFYDTIHIDSTIYYIVEGDLLLTADEVRSAITTVPRVKSSSSFVPFSPEGIKSVMRFDLNNDLYLWKGAFPIKYCVSRRSFANNLKLYNEVKIAVRNAAKDWKDSCDVEFLYRNFDNSSIAIAHQNVDFVVEYRPGDLDSTTFAVAFVPEQFPKLRSIRLFPCYKWSGYDLQGIFRHELGHILGFRHEHSIANIYPPSCGETALSRYQNQYDNIDTLSFMMYNCGDFGSGFQFSRKDIRKIRDIYKNQTK